LRFHYAFTSDRRISTGTRASAARLPIRRASSAFLERSFGPWRLVNLAILVIAVIAALSRVIAETRELRVSISSLLALEKLCREGTFVNEPFALRDPSPRSFAFREQGTG